MQKNDYQDLQNMIINSRFRELTADELAMVSGGDEGGELAGVDVSDSADSNNGNDGSSTSAQGFADSLNATGLSISTLFSALAKSKRAAGIGLGTALLDALNHAATLNSTSTNNPSGYSTDPLGNMYGTGAGN